MLSSLIEFFVFIGSTGVLFSERFRSNRLAVFCAGCIALASSWFLGETVLDRLGYLHHVAVPSVAVQSSLPTEAPQSRQTILQPAPGVEQIFPPQTAIDIRPIPGTAGLTFFLADWVSWSASDIKLSSWISKNDNFVRVSSNQYAYLGAGDQTTLAEPVSSSERATVAICVSYRLNDHHVEVIQFFSNLDGGGYRRARDNVFQVDGSRQLCQSMPGPALQALRQ